MLTSLHNNGEFISHAFLLEEREKLLEELLTFFEEIGINTKGNPDLWHREYESFGIGEARELRATQTQGAFAGDKRLFIIRAKAITPEAQNALLKTFEEPTAGTHFFLIVPNRDLLLPTLLSRLMFVGESTKKSIKENSLVGNFLTTTPSKRLELLEEIIKEKDRSSAMDFLNGLEISYSESDITKKDIAEFLETLLEFKKYLSQRGSSVKMILEHIALTAPKK